MKTIEINGQTVDLPPQTFVIDRKKVEFWPEELVFQVFNRKRVCVGACASLNEARRLMRKRGRNAGHILNVDVDHRPRTYPYWFHVARIVIAHFGRHESEGLKINYLGKAYPE